jgi:hypothetical protein
MLVHHNINTWSILSCVKQCLYVLPVSCVSKFTSKDAYSDAENSLPKQNTRADVDVDVKDIVNNSDFLWHLC